MKPRSLPLHISSSSPSSSSSSCPPTKIISKTTFFSQNMYDNTQTTAAMASHHLCLTLTLLLLSFTSLVSALSTFSISETSNLTIICALTTNSSLNCTSTGFPSTVFPVNPSASFSGVVSGEGFICPLRTFSSSSSSSSIMHCWRFSANNMTIVEYKRIYRGPALSQLEAGNSHICGLVNWINGVKCWQWHQLDTSNTPSFASIAVGQDFLCGLSQNGNIDCLGLPSTNTSVIGKQPTSETFSQIAAGFRHVCAIKDVDGGLVCWGDMVIQEEVPQQGPFKGLALGENRSCALRDNGTVVCWGQNNFSLPPALQGSSFLSIEAKRSVFCGVMTDNFSLYCWGSDAFRSYFLAFEEILPGPCTKTCSCQIIPSSDKFCRNGEFICEPCNSPPLPPLSPPPLLPPQRGSSSHSWNGKIVAFLVVGCVLSLSLVLVAAHFLYRHCGCKCRVHESSRLNEPAGTASEHSAIVRNF